MSRRAAYSPGPRRNLPGSMEVRWEDGTRHTGSVVTQVEACRRLGTGMGAHGAGSWRSVMSAAPAYCGTSSALDRWRRRTWACPDEACRAGAFFPTLACRRTEHTTLAAWWAIGQVLPLSRVIAALRSTAICRIAFHAAQSNVAQSLRHHARAPSRPITTFDLLKQDIAEALLVYGNHAYIRPTAGHPCTAIRG